MGNPENTYAPLVLAQADLTMLARGDLIRLPHLPGSPRVYWEEDNFRRSAVYSTSQAWYFTKRSSRTALDRVISPWKCCWQIPEPFLTSTLKFPWDFLLRDTCRLYYVLFLVLFGVCQSPWCLQILGVASACVFYTQRNLGALLKNWKCGLQIAQGELSQTGLNGVSMPLNPFWRC